MKNWYDFEACSKTVRRQNFVLKCSVYSQIKNLTFKQNLINIRNNSLVIITPGINDLPPENVLRSGFYLE